MAVQTQDEDARAAALSQSTAGSSSATAQAQQKDAEEERLADHPRGSTIEIEGAPTAGDFGGGEPQEPRGLLAEPAAFTPLGTIPAAMVSSPGGFVPLSAIPEGDRENRLQSTLGKQPVGDQRQQLSEDELAALDGPSIRAIAVQRGYKDIPEFGSRSIRKHFLIAQAKDPLLFEEKKSAGGVLRRLVGK
jgi:hypothetical protein